jgi:four helix bundle protein
MASPYRRLTAYEASVRLGREVHEAVAKWRSLDQWTVGVQLIRAVDSIGANIAESSGRVHAADKRRFLVIAKGSYYETEHWLALARDRNLLNTPLGEQLPDIGRALSGLIRRL